MKKNELYKAIFNEEYVEEKYKYEGHNFSRSVCGKPYCVKCGLVALNNDFSRWSVDKGCLSHLHPSYKSQKRKTTPFK